VAALLQFSRLIDTLSQGIGVMMRWLILATVLISAFAAIARKTLNIGSNAALELQWYLFAAVFMLGAAYVFLHNAHVRIDFVASRLSRRTNALIDVLGIVVFLIPLCLIMIDLAWPFFLRAYESGELSENAGGLIRWPVLLTIPVGFALLLLQALSELIKRVAFLTGKLDSPFSFGDEQSAEEALARELAAEQAAQEAARLAGPGAAAPSAPQAPKGAR
jgi:TRAP-type mannitol/chloroaromatic compound transport system permease small subunit